MRSGRPPVRIVTAPEELAEGLFGQVLLYIFEVLPYLRRRQVWPEWDIRTMHYGRVIPGLMDLAYRPEPAAREVPLAVLRRRHCSRLGDDWHTLHALWSSYFRVPERIVAKADALGPLADALGVHYRGTDKIAATWDTNPVSHADFLAIIRDFHGRRPHLRRIFLATDDNSFADYLRRHLESEVINLGDVPFHKEADQEGGEHKADRALIDCLLLSRCGAVLQTSSALSAFTKILQPDLEVYRCAASKLFNDIPYFPTAYPPRYSSSDPSVAAIVARLMKDDWTTIGPLRARPFAWRPRSWKNEIKYTLGESFLGAPV